MSKFDMKSRRFSAALAGGIALAAASLGPASAQNPLEAFFGTTQPQSAQPSAPARTAPAPAKAPALGSPPSASARPATAMRPPKRPDEGAPAQADAKPAATAPSTAVASANAVQAAAGPLGEKQVLERANAYFNGISSLVGDFNQIGGDGRRLTGKLYLQRPGKIRFEYDAPATLEVIADGSSVAVRDRKLATQDLYSIGQTPLKFLLRDRIDLGRDLKVMEVAPDADGMRVSVEDRSTLGGTSKITLYFDKDVNNLNRWRIIDPQGFQTTVSLANIERNQRVEQKLFTIDYQRILNDK